ncbi:MAG: hypothetical protein LIO51_04865 [Clostridiales bacterium]|nr:hypothetical protein [Clostridiales bacterium]
MEALDYLKGAVTDGMTLDELVDAFERMCQIPIADDSVRLDTGRVSLNGERLFRFSMVRVFPIEHPSEDKEYTQIHLDILYPAKRLNWSMPNSVWSDQLNQSIFSYIRSSKAFGLARQENILGVKIYMDEM